jgi:hypothetical protein
LAGNDLRTMADWNEHAKSAKIIWGRSSVSYSVSLTTEAEHDRSSSWQDALAVRNAWRCGY